MDNNTNIQLLNEEVRKQIITEIKKAGNIAVNYNLNHDKDLIAAISNITDDKTKADVAFRIINIIESDNAAKNSIFGKLVLGELLLKEKWVNQEIEKDKIRMNLFNSKLLIIFLMCFPIFAAFLGVYLFKSFAFSAFIIVIWYGVLVAFYFSNAINFKETVDTLFRNRRNL